MVLQQQQQQRLVLKGVNDSNRVRPYSEVSIKRPVLLNDLV